MGARVIMSAHGVSVKVQNEASLRELDVFDATCPLVTKVHAEVKKLSKQGYEIIMIGHSGHPEVEGTMGQLEREIHLVEDAVQAKNVKVKSPKKLSYVTQTTLPADDTAEIIKTNSFLIFGISIFINLIKGEIFSIKHCLDS